MSESTSSAGNLPQEKTPGTARQISIRWRCIYLWWNSLRVVSLVSTIGRWSIAAIGIIVLVLGMRQSQLQEKAKADDKAASEREKAASAAEQAALNQKVAATESKATEANAKAVEGSTKQAELEQQNRALRGDLEKLQPKPLKDRILATLDTIDPSIRQYVSRGKRVFRITLSQTYSSEIEKLYREDGDHAYILKLESCGLTVVNEAMWPNIVLTISEELAK